MLSNRPCNRLGWHGFATVFISVLLSATIAECGEDVLNASPANPPMPPGGLSIWGTVKNVTPDISEESLNKLEQPSDKLMDLIEELLKSRPVPGAIVILQNGSEKKQTVADANGIYRFTGLSEGNYQLSAEAPSGSPLTKTKASGSIRIRLPQDCGQWPMILIHADPVAVKGRITSADGKPISGAKVIGTPFYFRESGRPGVPYADYHPNYASRISTVSAMDGSYELQPFIPPSLYGVGNYLYCGDLPRDQSYVEICVEADGFVQDKEAVPRIPLVTEKSLPLARRVTKPLFQLARRAGQTELNIKERTTLPASKGNTITGVDVVLTKVEPGVK